jgi:cell division inhibitor SepF
MSDGDARRLIDFASGLSQGLYGKIERGDEQGVPALAAHVVVSGEAGEADGDVDASFFTHA